MVKLIRDNGNEVILEDRPWLLGLFLIVMTLLAFWLLFEAFITASLGLTLAALAIGGGALLALRTGIRATRLTLMSSGQAHLRLRGHGGTTARSFAPGTLRAGLETHRDGDGETYRCVLLIDGEDGVERLPLTPYFSGNDSGQRAVERINDWHRATS